MSDRPKSIRESLLDSIALLGVGLHAALSTAADQNDLDVAGRTDPDFERWLHNDPMVTGNPASRYSDDAPGYVTGNGLGSLEIGAAED